ncbi:MAG: hypothetical protein Q7J06_10875 [Bacteroidales bacterium]|nr:hypothetical protein [Bacteroidales bacterium]
MRRYGEAKKLIIASTDEAGNRYFQAELTILKAFFRGKSILIINWLKNIIERGSVTFVFLVGMGMNLRPMLIMG